MRFKEQTAIRRRIKKPRPELYPSLPERKAASNKRLVMSLHNRAVTTAILLLYAPFIRHFCPVCSFVFHFCCLNLYSAVFHWICLASFLLIRKGCFQLLHLAFNLKLTTRIFFTPFGLYCRFHLFFYILVTHIAFFCSNSIQNLKIAWCVISSFYKAFVQFSSRSIELIL